MGRPFMPHQRFFVDVFLEVQSEEAGDPSPGEWAYDDATWTVERRGGKTSIITPIAAHRARMIRRAQMFMTAQNRDKAKRRWLDVTEDILGSVLRGDVRRKVSNTHEELRWVDGAAVLLPFAPNDEAMHSETPDLVFIDEVWAYSAEQARAVKAGYVPAFATSSGQAIKMSTQGTTKSAWLNQLTKSGRAAVEAGTRLGVMFHEYSIPDSIDGKPLRRLTDEELIAACVAWHPAICHVPGCPGPVRKKPCPHGFTVRPAAVRSAWTELDDRAEFIRAYGNRSADDVAKRWLSLDETRWVSANDDTSIPADAPVAFGVWVDEDGDDAAVAAGWRGPDGVMHVELLPDPSVGEPNRVAVRPGVRWVREYLEGLETRPRAVAVPNTGAARDVGDELEAAGMPVLRVSQADVAAACQRHKSALGEGSWKHRLSTEGTEAAAATGWRAGRSGMWERVGESISPLGAHTLAGWGWDHAPEPEPVAKFWMG